MGQKVSPIGLRVGINKGWESTWYAEKQDFAKFLANDNKIRKYLTKKLKDASVSSVLIERNEKRLDMDVLIEAALAGVEKIEVYPKL